MKVTGNKVTFEFKAKTKHSVTFVIFVTWGLYNFIGYNLMYNIEPSPYLIEHSLIQKAVRRGNVELVEKVFTYLLNNNGRKWLRDRLAVIGYEECWPYANTLDFTCTDPQLLEQYKAIACRVKNKDCDGLAYLAKRLNQWNEKAVIGNAGQQLAIKRIAAAIKDDTIFWPWIEKQPDYAANQKRIEAAKKAIKRPGMKKDKAIMLSAAYLSVTYPIPDVEIIEPNNSSNFQYWVALDKHTGEGEEIIGQACEKINIRPFSGYFLAFYFAGALCNKIQELPFFPLSKRYNLDRLGFTTCDQAKEKWRELRPLIIEMTKREVDWMLERINKVKDDSDELELF